MEADKHNIYLRIIYKVEYIIIQAIRIKIKYMIQTKLDFTNEFKPIWQRFKWFLTILLCLLVCLFIVVAFIKNWDVFKYLFILGVLGSWLGWLYFDFALRCPNCKQRFVFWWDPDISPYIRVFLTGECYNCGTILKKKWMSQEEFQKLWKRLFITIIVIIVIGITGAFIKVGIGIKYEHVDIPESECK